MDYAEVAKRVNKDLGGPSNVLTAAHCATRLRLILKNVKNVDQKALDRDPDVKGTYQVAGQFQVIIGPGDVAGVYDEYVKLTGVKTATPDELKKIAGQAAAKQNPVMALVKVLSDIFVPLIPALVAGGLLMALNNILTSAGMFGPRSLVQMFPAINGAAQMVDLMASAPFTFLPILIGFTATKRFGGNEILGAAAGMMLVMPSLINGYNVAQAVANGRMPQWDVFGLHIAQAGYQGQVLPVIGVAFLLATLEKFFHKHLKGAIDFTFTPMLALIITGFLTFIVVGPVLRIVSNGLTDALTWLVRTFGFIGYGIFGSFYSAIVVTGLHQSFPAIETQLLANIKQTGGDFIFPIATVANVAQGAATFAIYFLTKGNEKMRALSSSSGASAMLGITEPAIFGVNLKYKFPFFIALGASGAAALVMGLFSVMSSSLGPAGLIGFIAVPPRRWLGFFLAVIVAFVLAFLATLFYGRQHMSLVDTDADSAADDAAVPLAPLAIAADDLTANAPVSGRIVDLADVDDPVFASKTMGDGIAIEPSETGINQVYAPVSGTLTVAYPTHHAYGLTGDNGVEVLIHLGLDTVNLKGKGFSSDLKQGAHVNAGDVLGTMDIDTIQAAGLKATTMVIVTNTANFKQILPVLPEKQAIQANQTLLDIKADKKVSTE